MGLGMYSVYSGYKFFGGVKNFPLNLKFHLIDLFYAVNQE